MKNPDNAILVDVLKGRARPGPVLLFSVILFICSAGFVLATEQVFFQLRNTEMVTGTLLSVSRNSIDVYDEGNRSVRRFVCLIPMPECRTGDRVRLDYTRENNVVQSIKKMTPLPYAADGQNLGYVIRKVSPMMPSTTPSQ